MAKGKSKKSLEEEIRLRAKYRREFLKRNPDFREALKIKWQEYRKTYGNETVPLFRKQFGLEWSYVQIMQSQQNLKENRD